MNRRNPRYVFRGVKGGLIPTREPEKITGLVGKKRVMTMRVAGYFFYLVDGAHIRAQHADFIGGGHHLVYRFVPKNEIWVDATVKEWPGYLASHELLEAILMQLRDWSYDRAHAAANSLEQELRGVGERSSLSGPKIAEIWGHHLRELFPRGEAVQTIADTVARMFWKYL